MTTRSDAKSSGLLSDSGAAPAAGRRRWSLWRSAIYGLLLTAASSTMSLLNDPANDLVLHVVSPTASSVAYIGGKFLAAPLIFVVVALVRNLLVRRGAASERRAGKEAAVFVVLLVVLWGAIWSYASIIWASDAPISGEVRSNFVSSVTQSCVQRQLSADQGKPRSSDAVGPYCACFADAVADRTTFRVLRTDDPPPEVLKDLLERAGRACQAQGG